jgi:prepilin-type N-terminal cleavage/methylation domain-containing protein
MRRGFTLLELLVSLAVAAVVMALALPGVVSLAADRRAAASLNQILGAVAYGRSQAILQRRTVTLCPGRAGRCSGRNQWHEGMLVFADDNGNGRIDGSDRVDRSLPALPAGGRVYWRSFRNRTHLQFLPRGYTHWQNGSFLYCPADNDVTHARMAIVNAQGRTRRAEDRDHDGVIEDAAGRPVVCPP